MADFYLAYQNDDGTYSKPKKWEGVLEITPITSSGEESDVEYIDLFTAEEITFSLDYKQTKDFVWNVILNLKRSTKHLVSKNLVKGGDS